MGPKEADTQLLRTAIAGYDFPRVTFDFVSGQEIEHPTMRDLEMHIRCGLTSQGGLNQVRDALSNVLYWGYARTGYRDRRVTLFRSQTSDHQLAVARDTFIDLDGAGLCRLKTLTLPQFSAMSFISKVRMFLDSKRYVVLDQKLMQLADVPICALFRSIRMYPTSIPVTKNNEASYLRWCCLCRNLAKCLFGDDGYAVDVERGVFWLVNSGRLADAARLVARAEKELP